VHCAGSSYDVFCVSEGRSLEEKLSRQSVVTTSSHAATKQATHQNAQRRPASRSSSVLLGDVVESSQSKSESIGLKFESSRFKSESTGHRD